MENSILKIEDYSVRFDTPSGELEAVRDINLEVKKGEILCIVGESGCGKTVLCQSVLKLLPKCGKIKNGKIILDGTDITGYKEKQMKKIRGSVASMIFQDPMMTLNPTIPIGRQITEAILKHEKISRDEAKKRAIEMLKLVGIDNAEERYKLQPHFFSGGMRQRCVIAVSLAMSPKIIFADEPTTALDVTVEAKILDLLLDIKRKTDISVVFVTHDLGTVARIADRVAVMYAGKIVEVGTAEDIFYDAKHPYTWGLLSSLPGIVPKGGELYSIQGMPPCLIDPPKGDAFAERNEYALAIDYEEMPPMFKVNDTHYAATWLLDERAPRVEPPAILQPRRVEWKKSIS